MSEFDIFKLIRSTPSRSKKNIHSKIEHDLPTDNTPKIEDFIEGKEEKKYKNRERKVIKKEEFLNEEIIEKKKEKKYKSPLRKINLVELDKLSVKNQNKILIREYIQVFETLEKYENELEKLDDKISSNNVLLHHIQRETIQFRDLIRHFVSLLPNGAEVKKQVETNSWKPKDIAPLIYSNIEELVDRAKNTDVHVEQATKQLNLENKTLQKKFVQQQTEIAKRDQYIEELKNYYEEQIKALTKQHQSILQKSKNHYEREMQKLIQKHESEISALKENFNQSNETPLTNPTPKPVIEEKPTPGIAIPRPIQYDDAPVKEPENTTPQTPENDFTIPTPEPEIPTIPSFEVEKETEQSLPEIPNLKEEEPEIPSIPSFDEEEPIVPTLEIPEPPELEIPSPPTLDIPEMPSIEPEEEEEEEEEDEDELVMFDPEPYLRSLSETNKSVIKIIGKTGISRNKELREFIESDEESIDLFMKGSKFNQQEMSSTIKGLKDAGFLNAETVKLGAKGGYNFTVYELSDLGKAIYKSLTGKKPVVSEKKKIMDQHASLEHGYLIKESAQEFKEMGYKVYTDRKDLRFDLPGGKRKDFDLIIEKDGKKCMIEVERGTHNEEDFFNAMDKIFQITNEFYFICPNEQVLFGKTKIAFFRWIKERLGGIQNAKGKLTAYFTTLEKVKKRGKTIWEPVDFK